VTLNSAAGISAGWVMEMDDYTTNPTDTEHVYLVSSSTQWQWGD
jgi:hypothetical protein